MGSTPSNIKKGNPASCRVIMVEPQKNEKDGDDKKSSRWNVKQQAPRQINDEKKLAKKSQSNLMFEIDDETYCLVLAAEEFHEQIMEHDDTIRAMSEVDTIHDNTDFVCELLDLRSHLHGELIRIEELLAQDDSTLQAHLNQYEVSNMDVIDKLKEIRDQTKFVKESLNRNNWKHNNGKAGGHFVPFNGDLAQDFSSYELPSHIYTMNELKELHKKEEELLCERFALLIADNQDTDEDVTKILAEHTYHVQAMKIKQDIQKNKLDLILYEQDSTPRARERHVQSKQKYIGGLSEAKKNRNLVVKHEYRRFSIFRRDESSEDKLKSIIKSLEEMRDRNELTQESLLNILTRYNLVPTNGSNAKVPQEGTSRTRASIIIHDSMEIKRQLQLRRKEMKNMMEAKLKQQLATKR
ncbi:hypothetical protein HELRODRAFT_173714 [Helobdella robusta]|uniref:Uncharacterized protein n=1 Tax=Helobdella robusta TaxID=6412 RepID=T1F755_HELRO|nr:hypothetical protein HELRODRAFT_173714 [Helobdella robusta]ESO03418.1 hypothetical protein HELRODRAFT_173714 [Helobdella robusta]